LFRDFPPRSLYEPGDNHIRRTGTRSRQKNNRNDIMLQFCKYPDTQPGSRLRINVHIDEYQKAKP
jgi:hypothetical protein